MEDAPRIASYQADPSQVGRVLAALLGRPGHERDGEVGSRERYGAEIVTLTVNLGQPGEDWDVVTGKAEQLGAVETILVDAREEFANDYVLPSIKANALYGGGYPLFTALGRAADRQAGGGGRPRARLRHDRARLHRQGQRSGPDRGNHRHARPELKIIAPVREFGRWAGRRRSPTPASTASP